MDDRRYWHSGSQWMITVSAIYTVKPTHYGSHHAVMVNLCSVVKSCPVTKSFPVSKSCPTPCNPMGCSLPGSSVHGIPQARGLEWVVISFSRGSSWPRDWTCASYVSFIAKQILFNWATNGIFTVIIIPLAGTNNCVDGIGLFSYDLSVPCYSLY